MQAGRPTLYREDFHPEEAVKLSKDGLNLVEICSRFEIGQSTLYDWENKHPIFAEHLSRARVNMKAHYYGKLRTGVDDPNFNARAAELLGRHNYKLEKDETKADVPGLKGAKTLTDEINAVKGALAMSTISPSDAKTMLETFNLAVKTEQESEFKPMLTELSESIAQYNEKLKEMNNE